MSSAAEHLSLNQRLFLALNDGGARTALIANDEQFSYDQLRSHVYAAASDLSSLKPQRLAIMTSRAPETYFIILASILSSTCYVPISSVHPEPKSAFIIDHCQCSHLYIDSHGCDYACDLIINHLSDLQIERITFLVSPAGMQMIKTRVDQVIENEGLDDAVKTRAAAFLASLKVIAADPQNFDVESFRPYECDGSEVMHILYTSGTTGQPKGVMVLRSNYEAYFASTMNFYDFRESDVFSHFAELTFDISLQDVVCALCSRASVVCPSKTDIMVPVRYFEKYGITVVHNTPSMIQYMERTGMLSRVKTPTVRIAIFAGEALWYRQVSAWHKAFPQCRIFNAFGPTEAAVIVCVHEVSAAEISRHEHDNSIVPLGHSFDNVTLKVVDESGRAVPEGTTGELLIGGPQVTAGYFRNEQRTAEAFSESDGMRWFHTGDQVTAFTHNALENTAMCAAGESFTSHHYLGRSGDMVKIKGFRISMYEVEEEFSHLTSLQSVAMKCSIENDGFNEAVLVVAIAGADEHELSRLRSEVKNSMSIYMRPEYIIAVDGFPLNANGKTDRKALKAMVINQAPHSLNVQLLD